MDPVRIIYEKGIEVRSRKTGWRFTSARDQQEPVTPADVVANHGVRPVVVTYSRSTGDEFDLFVLPRDGEAFGPIVTQLWDLGPKSLLRKTFDLQYLLGAVGYHCERMATLYAQVCRLRSTFPLTGDKDSDHCILGHQPEAYYEFDALAAAVRRSYDATRYLLWPVFGPGGSVPNSFRRTLETCTTLPSELKAQLEDSWHRFGNRLAAYRNCIQHYTPVDFGLGSARMKRLESGPWTVSFPLPDNPEVRSRARFRYDSQLDALSYAWTLTAEVLRLSIAILKACNDRLLS